MSESTSDPVLEPVGEAAAAAVAPPPVEGAVTDPPAPEPTEAPPEPTPRKPNAADRRFANLSARTAALQAERDAAIRDAEAARALLSAGKPETPTLPGETVEQAAQRLVAEREFSGKLDKIDAQGKKDFGAEAWSAAKDSLTSFGATTNPAFLQALAETDHPAKIFSALAEDSDALIELLRKSPAAMAAQLGRMDAKMENPPAKPPVSSAPRPAAPIQSGAVSPKEIDPWGPEADGLSMAEWSALAAKTDIGKKIFGLRR